MGGIYHRFGPTACETGKEQLQSLQVDKDPEKHYHTAKARIAQLINNFIYSLKMSTLFSILRLKKSLKIT